METKHYIEEIVQNASEELKLPTPKNEWANIKAQISQNKNITYTNKSKIFSRNNIFYTSIVISTIAIITAILYLNTNDKSTADDNKNTEEIRKDINDKKENTEIKTTEKSTEAKENTQQNITKEPVKIDTIIKLHIKETEIIKHDTLK